MALEQAVTVLGIGCRKGASGAAVLAAIRAVLAREGIGHVDGLATADFKRDEPGIAEAREALCLPVIAVDRDALHSVAARALTRSEIVEKHTGLPASLAECAALAAAGAGARLRGPRLALGPVTCALATDGPQP